MDIEEARQVLLHEFGKRLTRGPCFESPSVVKEYLVAHFAGREHEEFVVMYLTARNRLITCETLFRGTITQTSVYPREVVKEALKQNAAAVILAHNHPSGDCEPSRADELLTTRLKEALLLVDIKVLDHVVVAGHEAASFAELGLM